MAVRQLPFGNDPGLAAVQLSERLTILLHLRSQVCEPTCAVRPACLKLCFQFPAQFLIVLVLLQDLLRHAAGDKAGEVQTPEQGFFIGLLGHQPLKLVGAGYAGAEQVDDGALGLAGIAQDKDILAGEQSDGDDLNELITLGHLRPDFIHPGEHLVSQCLIHVFSSFSVSRDEAGRASAPAGDPELVGGCEAWP